MAEMEYKTVIAPDRPRKYKGIKSADERFARTLADTLNEAAAGGWVFERTEAIRMLVKRGTFGRKDYEERTMLIFAREKPMRGPQVVTAERAASPLAAPEVVAERREPGL